MKQKKYSESKIKEANKFLLNYDLTLDSLNEPQKKVLVGHINKRKYLVVILIVWILASITLFFMTSVYHRGAHSMIDKVLESSTPIELKSYNETMTLSEYGKKCYERGLCTGLQVLTAFIWILGAALYAMICFSETRAINAFLPALKNPESQ